MWKLFKKYWAVAVLVPIALGYVAVKIKHSEPIEKSSQIVIGLQSGYPPFEFMDANGAIVGFDVDLAHALAEKLDKKLVIKDMEFEGTILSLKQEKIDLILSGMNITPSRQKEILMIPYHGEKATCLSLIFWGEIPEGVQKLQDIAHLHKGAVSVESGTISEAFMSQFPLIHVKSFEGALTPLMDVKHKKSTANLVEKDVALYLKQQHPEITILEVPVPEEEQLLGFGIGVKQSNGALYVQVSEIIEGLKSTGELKKLEDKWFKGEM